MSGQEKSRFSFFNLVNNRTWLVAAVVALIGMVLGLIAPLVGDDGEPDFSPGTGEIYETMDRAEEVFTSNSPTRGAVYVVDHPRGRDVLTRSSLLEFKIHSHALRADPEAQQHLVSTFDNDLGVEIDGILSVADAVDAQLPSGIVNATDAEVKLALSELLADGAPTSTMRFTLSNLATREPATTTEGVDFILWESPAYTAQVRYDIQSFPGVVDEDAYGGATSLEAERWLRFDVEETLSGDQVTATGVAVDAGLTEEAQGNEAAPFIFGAVAIIVLFVGALLRSYWAAMIVSAGLGVVMMSYNGVNALIGLKVGSALLIMIVPIALISFGVDFFIHGSGRTREMQVAGHSRDRAYPLGMRAVFTALLLAALSSIAAFLSNAASGIQAITEFGIAAAIAIALSYVVLGLIAPRVLLQVEEGLGPRPARGLMIPHKFAFLIAALIAGTMVTMTIVMPQAGVVVFAVFIGLFVYLPYRRTKRRNLRAAEAGEPLTEDVKGAGHGLRAAGTTVHFLARWRVVTIPVVVLLAILGGVAAFQVQEGFEIKEFFSPSSAFIQSLDKFEEYYEPSSGGGDYIYVEGDLTDPATLVAMEGAIADIDSSNADFARDFNGDLVVAPNATDVVRIVTGSEPARSAIQSDAGVAITDTDGDGLADAPEQVAAIYDDARRNGVVNNDGFLVFAPDQVERFLYVDGTVQATRLVVEIPTITDEAIILNSKEAMDAAADGLRSATGNEITTIGVTGTAIETQATLASFTDAMLTSLPIAILLTALLVLIVLRSFRYALVSMVPILLVVAWIYGFMYIAGYKINPITATIAAIAIGVGIDFSTHFTVRFLEEFEGEPSRFPALRRAGEGTGGALAISALTSILGFTVMALSPVPMFRTFGVLTAMMVVFALSVSLLVLPSLLLLVTPSRSGDERDEMIELVTQGDYDYEPHARATAFHEQGSEAD